MSNELDKHFGEQLHAYESDVDAEAIWAAVRPPRRRRPWFWFFLLFGVIGSAGGVWCLYTDEAAPTGVVKQYTQEQPIFNTEQQTQHTTQHNEGADKREVVAVTGSTEAGGITTAKTVEPMPSELTAVGSGNEGMELRKTEEASINSELSTNATETSGERTVDPVVAPAPIETMSSDGSNDGTNEQEIEHNEMTVVEPEDATPVADQSKNERLQTVISEVFETRDLATIDYRLPTRAGSLTNTHQLGGEVAMTEAYQRGRRSLSPWSAQLDGAYMAIRRTLASDSLPTIVAARIATESLLEAWSADLTVNYNWHKNWQVRAGFGYTQINMQFLLNTTQLRVDTVEGIQTIVFNQDGSVDSIAGPILQYETINRERRVYNSIRHWELPILVNYETSLGQLSLIAEAGVRLRLSRTWEGQVVADLGENVALWEDQDWYRTNLGLSLQAGLLLGYELNSQWQLRAGATVRYAPTDFSTAESAFQERYQLGGIQLGLRYQFR